MNPTTLPSEITNLDDYLDSRDIQERIDYLNNGGVQDLDDQDELKRLIELKEQYVDYYGDESWDFGAQFIRDSYFKDYAQELADDCGLINSNATWPNSCIDWDQAAHELQMDYTSIDFDGVDYWTRGA